MGAFLENSMLLFVDDAEPILPIFQSTEYGNTGRVVELADVGCDTETTFPIHFPHSAFDRHRGGVESLGSTRRITKWLNDRPNEFTQRANDINNDDRNRNYIRRKMRQNRVRDYDDEPDANFNNSYTENPYNFELPKNLAVENNYIQFINPQNTVAHSRRECVSRYNYLRDLESPFMQDIHIPLRKNISPRWLADSDKKNLCEIHDTDIQPGERKKRTKILSRTNGTFNREAELEQARDIAMYREQNDLPNVTDSESTSSKNMFWDFISFENDSESEETTFYNPTRTKNHGLRKMAPRRRRSYIFNSQTKRVDVVDSEEEEFNETVKKNSRENLSSKIPINSEKYRTSKSDAVKEKSKILRLNRSNANSSRSQPMRTFVDEQISNIYSAEKDSINMRSHSVTEEKKNKFPATERRKEITNTIRTTVDDHRYSNKFVNKLSNNSLKKTGRLTRMFNHIADSTSNGRIDMENERDNTNFHRGNVGNSKIDQINVTASRLAPEKIMQNEKIFALRKTDISVPRTDVYIKKEKKRKFFSRLPIRTWKRLRTKQPAALRPESDTINEDKFQEVKDKTVKSNHPEKIENNVKWSERFETGSFSVDKPRLTSSDLKSIKEIKDLNATSATYEQWKKKMSVK